MSSLLFSSKAKRELAAKEDEEVKKKQQERMEQESEQSKRRFLAKAQQAEANDEQSTKRKTLEEEEGNAEIEMIKEQYLGKKKAKPVQKKISRSKFMFEWDAEKEDTSNPGDTYQVQLAFGRGSLGGMEKQEDTGRVMNRVKVKEEEALLKSRHWSEKKLEEMNERDWRIFNEDFNITTRGGSIPKPIRSWEEANLPNELLQTLLRVGYKEPTPVQRAAIPIGRQNRDLMAIAETGSGKTVAFVIPMLMYILSLPKMNAQIAENGPYAVVLAPTRELVQQIHAEVEKLSRNLGVRAMIYIGGTAQENQSFMLQNGAEIIISTPGRLVDNLKKKYVVLNQCNYIVLDEADRMIEMNFEDQLVEILESMPSSNLRPENISFDDTYVYRQTTMFSATMPVKVELLARKYLRNPAYLAIGERSGTVVDRIQQTVLWVTENMKQSKLLNIVRHEDPPIIVFCNAKKNCDTVAKFLIQEGFSPSVLHSGKSQEQREISLENFKSGSSDILVATDVAGRGLDIKGVTHVINYDMPKTLEIYMHRIGRTGRAGLEGKSTSFLTNEDTDIMYDLKQMLIQNDYTVPAELSRHEAAQVRPGTAPSRSSRVIFKM